MAQMLAHGLDAVDDALGESTFAKCLLHAATNMFPRLCADSRVYSTVGQYLDVSIGEKQINQHAVVVFRVPHVKLGEDVERPFARGAPAQERHDLERGLDREADLPAMGRLGFFNSRLDRAERRRWKRVPYSPARRAQVSQ